ncbi:interferon alpha-21-like [Engraulis encrasicolus]|uniref:interferon alpha-21-like n=1 Tax=Engraulis encrasicolus TaxID=184585 RepID=UPI002FD557B8
MHSGNLVQFCVVLCAQWLLAEGCRWAQFQLGSKNEESVLLLSKMGGHFPLGCVKEKGARLFPQGVYEKAQGADVAEVALEALGYVRDIFRRDMSEVTSSWNQSELELFINILHRQIEKLKPCVGSQNSNENATLKSYFEKLNAILTEKDLSACAWEIVRDEVHFNLVQLHAFLQTRKTK